MCDPDLAEAHYNFGLALAQSGNLDESGRELTDAISLNPKYTDARVQLGLVLSQKNDAAGAANVFASSSVAIRLSLKDTTIWAWCSSSPVRCRRPSRSSKRRRGSNRRTPRRLSLSPGRQASGCPAGIRESVSARAGTEKRAVTLSA